MLSMCCPIIAIIFLERHTKHADYHVCLVILLIKYMLNKALDTKEMRKLNDDAVDAVHNVKQHICYVV